MLIIYKSEDLPVGVTTCKGIFLLSKDIQEELRGQLVWTGGLIFLPAEIDPPDGAELIKSFSCRGPNVEPCSKCEERVYLVFIPHKNIIHQHYTRYQRPNKTRTFWRVSKDDDTYKRKAWGYRRGWNTWEIFTSHEQALESLLEYESMRNLFKGKYAK
jgi:hypothetical protein